MILGKLPNFSGSHFHTLWGPASLKVVVGINETIFDSLSTVFNTLQLSKWLLLLPLSAFCVNHEIDVESCFLFLKYEKQKHEKSFINIPIVQLIPSSPFVLPWAWVFQIYVNKGILFSVIQYIKHRVLTMPVPCNSDATSYYTRSDTSLLGKRAPLAWCLELFYLNQRTSNKIKILNLDKSIHSIW